MKKNLITVFLLLTSTITIPSDIDASIEQSSDYTVPVEAYQAIEQLDYEKLVSILAVTGPLSKEAKGLPLLTLYRLRDEVLAEGLLLRARLVIGAEAFDINTAGLSGFACLSLAAGTTAGLTALCFPDVNIWNRLLLGVASSGALALCSYTIYILAKKKQKKIADLNVLLEPFNQKLDIIINMIVLLENHPESQLT